MMSVLIRSARLSVLIKHMLEVTPSAEPAAWMLLLNSTFKVEMKQSGKFTLVRKITSILLFFLKCKRLRYWTGVNLDIFILVKYIHILKQASPTLLL